MLYLDIFSMNFRITQTSFRRINSSMPHWTSPLSHPVRPVGHSFWGQRSNGRCETRGMLLNISEFKEEKNEFNESYVCWILLGVYVGEFCLGGKIGPIKDDYHNWNLYDIVYNMIIFKGQYPNLTLIAKWSLATCNISKSTNSVWKFHPILPLAGRICRCSQNLQSVLVKPSAVKHVQQFHTNNIWRCIP